MSGRQKWGCNLWMYQVISSIPSAVGTSWWCVSSPMRLSMPRWWPRSLESISALRKRNWIWRTIADTGWGKRPLSGRGVIFLVVHLLPWYLKNEWFNVCRISVTTRSMSELFFLNSFLTVWSTFKGIRISRQQWLVLLVAMASLSVLLNRTCFYGFAL